jgi:hypothetical protein
MRSEYKVGSNSKLLARWRGRLVAEGEGASSDSAQCKKVTQKSFHVWGGITWWDKTKLHLFEGIVTADRCIELLEQTMVPAIHDLYKGWNKNKHMIVGGRRPEAFDALREGQPVVHR